MRLLPFAALAVTAILPLATCAPRASRVIATEHLISATPGQLKAGFGTQTITPPLRSDDLEKETYYLAGYDRGRRAKSIHDDLWARAVVFEVGGKRVGIVALDVIGYFNNYVETLRARVPADLRLTYLIVHSTHNHEAPDTMGMWGPGTRSGSRADYHDWIQLRAVEALRKAVDNLAPARVRVGQTPTRDLNAMIDTRLPLVIPHTLTAMRFEHADTGRALGTITHWNCHVEALGPDNTAITSDYPHYLRKAMEARYPGAPALFWAGTVGGLMAPPRELPPGPPGSDDEGETLRQGTFEFAKAMGARLAQRAAHALETGADLAPSTLELARDVYLHEVTNEDFKTASTLGIFPREFVSGRYIQTETAQLRLGEITLQTIPGELYPELAHGPLDPPPGADTPDAARELPVLDDFVPGRFRMYLGLAQDEIGYIIPANAWDEKPPYLGNAEENSYGEEVSTGPASAAQVHASIQRAQNAFVPRTDQSLPVAQ